MKKTMKLITSIVLVASLMMPTMAFAAPTPEPTPEAAENMQQIQGLYMDFVEEYGLENVPSVYYNGASIGFTDTFPLIKEGTTFVPIRAFTDAIGAEITYVEDTNCVSIESEGETISFVIGSKDVKVGEKTLTLAANTFELNDRTYVPVRLIAEAFNLEVLWNELYGEVSIMDIEALKEGLATDYTVMDSILGMKTDGDLTSNYAIEGAFELSLTMDGKTVIANTDINGLANMEGQSYDSKTTVDMSDFQAEIEQMLAQIAQNPAQVEMIEGLLAKLENITVEYRIDMKTLDIYIRSNMFDYLGAALGTTEINNDTWIKIAYKDLLPEEQYEEIMALMEMSTSGDVVMNTQYMVELLLDMYKEMPLSMMNYYEMIDTGLNMISDDKFEKSGNTYILKETTTDALGVTTQFELSVKMGTDGIADSYTLDFKMADDQTIVTMSVEQASAEKVKMQCSVEIVGQAEIHMNYDLTMKKTTKKPEAMPTENVFDLMKMLTQAGSLS